MQTNCSTIEQFVIIDTVYSMLKERKNLKERLLSVNTSLTDFLKIISRYQILDATLKRCDSV